MHGLLALIVQSAAGLAGGGLAGTLVRAGAMPPLRRLLAGVAGGMLGGTLLAAIFNGMTDPAELAAAGAVDAGTLIVQLAGAAFAGGVATGMAARLLPRRNAKRRPVSRTPLR